MRRLRPICMALTALVATAWAEDPPAGRVLRVVDQDGRAVAGVEVKTAAADEAQTRTDAKGEARFPAGAFVTFFDGRDDRRVELKNAVTEVVAAHFPEVEVVVVDGTSGRAMDDAPARIVGTGEVALAAPSRRARMATDDIGRCSFAFAVEPPPGFASTGWRDWSGQVAPRSTRVRLAVPVYPEIRRKAIVAPGARLTDVMVGGTAAEPTAAAWREVTGVVADKDGLVEIPGLPGVPLGRASLTFRASELVGIADVLLDGPAPAHPLRVALGPPQPPWHPPGMPVTMPGPPPRGTTSVIRVLLRDGTPAPHVAVRIGDRQERTDGDGRARFVGLAGGKIVAVASGRGVVPTAARIDVGGAAEATIHEAASHRVHVEVVDGDGRPLAGAGVGAVSFTVPVSGGDDLVPAEDCVAQYDGDVEMIDVLTGADGRVDVELPSGRHRICAWIGEAFAFVETMSDDVKVVLRRKP